MRPTLRFRCSARARWWLVALVALGSASSMPGAAAAFEEPHASQQTRAGRDIPPRPERLRLPELDFEPPDPAPLRHELSDGTPVWIVEDHAVPLVEISVVLEVGGDLDPPDHPGLASLTGAMLRRAGAGERDADRLDEEIDYLGADLDSFGGRRRSGLSLECSPHVLAPALELLADVWLRPRFEGDRLETALANLRTNMRTRNDDPTAVAQREWDLLLWGERHPLARQLTVATLENLDREDLVRFHRQHWLPRDAILAVSGDVDTVTVLEHLERLFADRRAAVGQAGPQPLPPPPARQIAEPGLYFLPYPTPQAKVFLGHRGALLEEWIDGDRFGLIVMSEIFGGGGAVSRLRGRLRGKEALVYRVRSGLGIGTGDQPGDEGDFFVFFETEPDLVSLAVASVLEEIERIRTTTVPDVELDLAQRSLEDAFPLLFDDAESIAGRYAEDELIGRPHEYWEVYRRRVRSVRPRVVQFAARRWLDPSELRVLVVGPDTLRESLEREVLPALRGRGRDLTVLGMRDPFTLEILDGPSR